MPSEETNILDEIIARRGIKAPGAALASPSPQPTEPPAPSDQEEEGDPILNAAYNRIKGRTPAQPEKKEEKPKKPQGPVKYDTDKAAREDIDTLKLVRENPELADVAAEIEYKRRNLPKGIGERLSELPGKGLEAAGAAVGAAGSTLKSLALGLPKVVGNTLQNVAYSPVTVGRWASQTDSATHGLDVAQDPFSNAVRSLTDYVDPVHGLGKLYNALPQSVKDKAKAEMDLNAVESAGAIETATAGTYDLANRLARIPADKIKEVSNAIQGKGLSLTKEQIRDQLIEDANLQKTMEQSGQGDTALLKDVVNKEKLFAHTGVDPEQVAANINDISFYADPLNIAEFGAGKAAGKVLSKTGQALRATELGSKALEKTAQLGAVASKAKNLVKGTALEALGETGVAAQKVLNSQPGRITTAIVKAGAAPLIGTYYGGITGGLIGQGLKYGAREVMEALGRKATGNLAKDLTKEEIKQTVERGGFGKLAERGRALLGKEKLYDVALDEQGKPGFLSRSGKILKPALVGAGGGLAFAAPLLLTARNPEELGQLAGGAAATGAVGGIHENFNRAIDAYYQVKTNPDLRAHLSPEPQRYGTIPELDELNNKAYKALPEDKQGTFNMWRDLMQGTGYEIYVLPRENFKELLPKEAQSLTAGGFFTDKDKRIYLNGDILHGEHEIGHAIMATVGQKRIESLIDKVEKYHGKDIEEWGKRYALDLNKDFFRKNQEQVAQLVSQLETATNAGDIATIHKLKPQFDEIKKQAKWEFQDKKQMAVEWLAEQFQMLAQGQGIQNIGANRSISNRIFDTMADYMQRVSQKTKGGKISSDFFSPSTEQTFRENNSSAVPSFIAARELQSIFREAKKMNVKRPEGLANFEPSLETQRLVEAQQPKVGIETIPTEESNRLEAERAARETQAEEKLNQALAATPQEAAPKPGEPITPEEIKPPTEIPVEEEESGQRFKTEETNETPEPKAVEVDSSAPVVTLNGVKRNLHDLSEAEVKEVAAEIAERTKSTTAKKIEEHYFKDKNFPKEETDLQYKKRIESNPYSVSPRAEYIINKEPALKEAYTLYQQLGDLRKLSDPDFAQARRSQFGEGERISGKKLDVTNQIVNRVLSMVPDQARQWLAPIEKAIKDRQIIKAMYFSADSTDPSNVERLKQQKISTAKARASDSASGTIQEKDFIPNSFVISRPQLAEFAGGGLTAKGIENL